MIGRAPIILSRAYVLLGHPADSYAIAVGILQHHTLFCAASNAIKLSNKTLLRSLSKALGDRSFTVFTVSNAHPLRLRDYN